MASFFKMQSYTAWVPHNGDTTSLHFGVYKKGEGWNLWGGVYSKLLPAI